MRTEYLGTSFLLSSVILSSYTNTENAIGQSTVAAGKITAVRPSVRPRPFTLSVYKTGNFIL